ncbi:MAG: PIN domain-containing protein [Xanthomonadales bacterium]|nr:PIN domain-containing protein [Xanthomonadales bacterium]
MAWLFEDESTSATESLLNRLKTEEALVPTLWVYEVGNVLLMAERRKRIKEAQARRFTQLLESLPIRISDPHRQSLWSNAVVVAREHGLSVYDGIYLDLAMREGMPLATRDKALRRAAKKAGLEIY